VPSSRKQSQFVFADSRRLSSRRGFSLIDTLVTISVMVLLIAILLPSLDGAREAARRVVCSSNIRQFGIGLQMFADDRDGKLPNSIYLTGPSGMDGTTTSTQQMMTLRAPNNVSNDQIWDGLGVLYATEYLVAPKLFYCPSHHGDHPYSRYSKVFNGSRERVVGNYHFRGIGPNGERTLTAIEPSESVLVTDGMRVISDYNHNEGTNYLTADLAVSFLHDPAGEFRTLFAKSEREVRDSTVRRQWSWLDAASGVAAPSGR
jgi:competence protein ComGC